MNTLHTHNKLTPWCIGIAILAVIETYVGLRFVDEGGPELAQQAVLVAAPVLSLALMYLTLKSKDGQ